MAVEFIARDGAGWMEARARYTHMPSGDTLLAQPWMSRDDWDERVLGFMSRYPGLNIHSCPGRYSTDEPIVGTSDGVIASLLAADPEPGAAAQDGGAG